MRKRLVNIVFIGLISTLFTGCVNSQPEPTVVKPVIVHPTIVHEKRVVVRPTIIRDYNSDVQDVKRSMSGEGYYNSDIQDVKRSME